MEPAPASFLQVSFGSGSGSGVVGGLDLAWSGSAIDKSDKKQKNLRHPTWPVRDRAISQGVHRPTSIPVPRSTSPCLKTEFFI